MGEDKQSEKPKAALDLEKLNTELESEKAKSEQYLDSWKRAQADLENFKRQTSKDRGEIAKVSNSAFIGNLLPVLDDLERALSNVTDSLRGFTWIDGIWLIYKKLQAVLTGYGVSEIESVGKQFDPYMHQAVDYAEGDEGKIIEEVQKGYKLQDKVLRPALVKVGKKVGGPEDEDSSVESLREDEK